MERRAKGADARGEISAERQHRFFRVFLQDQLAALRAAVELGTRVKGEHDEPWMQEAARGFVDAALDDRRELLRLARDVGVEPSLPKEAGAWLAEKVARLKLNGRVIERSPLTLVVEVEGMCVLAAQREAMWRALVPVARARPELELRPAARAESAREQREALLGTLATASEQVLAGAIPESATVMPFNQTVGHGASDDAASPT